MDVSPIDKCTNERYLLNMSKSLKDTEKVVVLLIDEIYISSKLEYRDKAIVGSSINNDEIAKTVLAYMICSAFGSFQEIVKLLPVQNIKGTEMVPITLDIVKFVQQCGFEVICIVTDNHRINRTMFRQLSDDSMKFPNPDYPEQTIFLLYDFVHIFKNIRNNWTNLKNENKTFVFPDFEKDEMHFAKFSDLTFLYNKEKNSIVKKAYKLNYKSVNPTNLERQKVHLVDNIFHHSTIASAKDENLHDTAHFLEIIRNWWDIVNNRSTVKGMIKRNNMSEPIKSSSGTDERILFLNNFLIWLRKWHSFDSNGHLSAETYNALYQSTVVLVSIIDYCFQKYAISYILPGKFTTENLEKRFGMYRLMSGCNFNVSLGNIIGAEKKLRLQHILKKMTGNFSLTELESALECVISKDNVDVTDVDVVTNEFASVLDSNYLESVEVDESVQLYICGYIAHAISKKMNCNSCINMIVESKGECVGSDYFDFLQRGGLTVSSDCVNVIFTHMYAIFEFIMNHPEDENKFLKISKQKPLLCRLAVRSLERYGFADELDKICSCGKEFRIQVNMVCSILANIILNNYVKYKNNLKDDLHGHNSSEKSKKRKLSTYKK